MFGRFRSHRWVSLLLALLLPGQWALADDSLRVVSVGGALTEIIYALGHESLLVGVDTTSRWPVEAEALPKVGYQRTLAAEGLLSLAPDLIIATAEAGPAPVLQQVTGAGVRLEQFAEEHSVDAVIQRVVRIGELLGNAEGAEQLASRIRADVETAKAAIPQGVEKPRVAFMLNRAVSPMMAGSGTAAEEMLALAGAINPFADMQGYKSVSAEAMSSAAPDVILYTANGNDDLDIEALLPGHAATEPGQTVRWLAVDGLRFLGFGPRIGEALADLVGELYPADALASNLVNDAD